MARTTATSFGNAHQSRRSIRARDQGVVNGFKAEPGRRTAARQRDHTVSTNRSRQRLHDVQEEACGRAARIDRSQPEDCFSASSTRHRRRTDGEDSCLLSNYESEDQDAHP